MHHRVTRLSHRTGRMSDANRSKTEAAFDRGQDRCCVVLCVVGRGPIEVPRHQERGDARTRSELVMYSIATTLSRWRHVVPLAAKFVIGYNHERIVGIRTVIDRHKQVAQMLAALVDSGISGMFVLFTDRLHETDRPEPPLFF